MSSGSWSRPARFAPRGLRCPAALQWDSILTTIVGVVKGLKSADFYKSMTTHGDHRIWQDVYRPATRAGKVYLKLTVIDDVLIVSFKEL